MPRAEASVTKKGLANYSVEAWLEGDPLADGCELNIGTRIADKKNSAGFLITATVVTEDVTEYPVDPPPGSKCESIECYKYYVHFVVVMGIGISVSSTAGVSGTWNMAQHDHYITLRVGADGRSASEIVPTRTTGPAGDVVTLFTKDALGQNSIRHTL